MINISYCPLIVGSNLSKVSEIFICQWLGPYLSLDKQQLNQQLQSVFFSFKILYEVHHFGILSSSSRKLAK